MILFPNPCPVCGTTDEHAAWAQGGATLGSPATFCPHPAESGHGTGCCCAGRSKSWTAELLTATAGTPSLEDRVAALEAAMTLFTRKSLERGDITINDARAAMGLPALELEEAAMTAPLRAYVPSWTPLTEAEEAEFKVALGEAAKLPLPLRIMPEPPPLSPDEIRQLLRECVTVVKPGETLIVRGTNWTPGQTREIQQVMDEMHELGIVPFKALAVFGDELGVAEPQP
jgi:hypothetical protein